MAISIDWGNSIINIPRLDMPIVQSTPTEIRKLDLDLFRLELKDLEDSSDGMAFTRTHKHNTAVTIGGVVLSRVIEILDPYTITFEDGQYAVNLIGANSNVGDRVNVNQVSVRSTNSAGLQDLSTLLSAAYNGKVSVDVINGQAGTTTPLGTRSTPVNNFADALTIANNNSLKTFDVMSSATLTVDDFSNGFEFVGDNRSTVTMTINADTNVINCIFSRMTIQGTLDGNNTLKGCTVKTLNYVEGIILDCGFSETIQLASDLTGQANIINCFSLIAAGATMPVIDFNSTGSMVMHDYSGNIKFINYTGGAGFGVNVGITSGLLTLDPTLTGGTITIRGEPSFDDQSNGTTIVDNTSSKLIPAAIFTHPMESGETYEEQVRLMRAEAAGKSAVVGNVVTFRDAADTKDRITATTDANGQRLSVTVDGA